MGMWRGMRWRILRFRSSCRAQTVQFLGRYTVKCPFWQSPQKSSHCVLARGKQDGGCRWEFEKGKEVTQRLGRESEGACTGRKRWLILLGRFSCLLILFFCIFLVSFLLEEYMKTQKFLTRLHGMNTVLPINCTHLVCILFSKGWRVLRERGFQCFGGEWSVRECANDRQKLCGFGK